MPFVHLHLHSEYSLLDGACRINELVNTVKQQGMNSVAITDHGVMYGVVDFYKAAKKAGIKPIIGCEVYVAQRSRFDKVFEFDRNNNHLVLLCKNNKGYENLCKIISLSYTEGFYFRPRVDHELLRSCSEGIIALSSCLQGEIPKALYNGDYNKAKEIALKYKDIFGENNFFLEMQDHGLPEQKVVNNLLINLSKDTNIQLVATNDTHYINKSDSKVQKALILIGTNKTINDQDALTFGTEEYYLKSEAEMLNVFSNVKQAVSNTQLIADRCNVELEFGVTKLPFFEVPDNKNHYDYFQQLCYQGLKRKVGDNANNKEYIHRLDYELKTINNMGYVDYFLIVSDFVNYAKSKDIPVGPGRGSGAASLAAYCLGITDVDPIRYNLLFERFLNPERVTMPDFDIDFCYIRRQEVINYVINKYGSDRVAQIITFGTLAARAAIRDVGRAMAIPYNVVDMVAKLVPNEPGQTISHAIEKTKDLKSLFDSDNTIKQLLNMAKRVEGMPRHASTHAAGVVITQKPVHCYVPLAKNDEAIVTQFTMTALEELGLLKMDFLGLRNLTIIDKCVQEIQKTEESFKIENIPTDDKMVFKMFSKGLTEGVFQFESNGMKRVMIELQPVSIEDLIALISLYRPGPMQSIPKYIKNRHNPSLVNYPTPLLKPILDVTNGCLVYQEQVMQVFRVLAGYPFGKADIVRRAMAKKKHNILEKERLNFITGCKDNGIDENVSNNLFDEISAFSSYAFNKAHAAAYAIIAYRTAFLKCHYPAQYMSSLLSSVLDRTNKVTDYIEECSKMNIKLLPPHANRSKMEFSVEGNNIRFGLLAIKNIGIGLIENLISERSKNGEFKSFYDLCKRLYSSQLNRRALESLILSGCVDNLGNNRREMLESIDLIFDNLNHQKRRNIDGQIGFFETESNNAVEMPKINEFDKQTLLKFEKSVTGLYLSGHPMQQFKDLSIKLNADRINEIVNRDIDNRYKDNQYVTVLGIIEQVKKKVTKKGDAMAILNIEDSGGAIEMLVFPKTFQKYINLINEGNIILISGRVNFHEEKDPQLICELITLPQNITIKTLYVKVPSINSKEFDTAKSMLSKYSGKSDVCFYCEDTKKVLKLASFRCNLSENLLNDLSLKLGKDSIKVK